jgi:hypothetical protein
VVGNDAGRTQIAREQVKMLLLRDARNVVNDPRSAERKRDARLRRCSS